MREPSVPVLVLLLLGAALALVGARPARGADAPVSAVPLDRRAWPRAPHTTVGPRPSAWLNTPVPSDLDDPGRMADVRRCTRIGCRALTPRDYWYRSFLRPSGWADWAALSTTAAVGLGGVGVLLAGDDASVNHLSDLGEVALTALGYGVPAAEGDGPGFVQFGLSYACALRLSSIGKDYFAVMRPDGLGADSFPSAHTTSAFTAAAFLHSRYGPTWGVPSYALATIVGATRLRLDRHRLTDVVAGAGLGMLTAWAFAIPFGGECHELTRFGHEPRWRFEFAYGALLQARTEVRAPRAGGTTFDLARQDRGEQAYPTARFSVHYRLRPRHEVMLRIDPLELVDVTSFRESVRFDGIALDPDESVPTRWTANRYVLRWRYALSPPRRRLQTHVGLGTALAICEARLEGDAGTARARHRELMLGGHVSASYEFLPRIEARAALDLGAGLESRGGKAEVGLRWQITDRWDVGVGARLDVYRIDASALRSDTETHILFLAFGRSF